MIAKNKKPIKKIAKRKIKKSSKKLGPTKLSKKTKKIVEEITKNTKPIPIIRKTKIDLLQDQAKSMIELGKMRGFVTYDEILKEFPNIENNILFLDEFY